jgi:excisionase family DNA binding protein
MNMNTLFTLEDVAELLKCSKHTVKRLIKNGHLEYVDITPATLQPTYRFTQEMIDRFIKSRTTQTN